MKPFCGFIFICSLFELLYGIRVKDIIYVPLYDSEYACFRLLNGTHQTGCQSGRSGSTGVVHLIQSDSDKQFVLQDPQGNAPFIVAMRLNYFEKNFLEQLRDSGKAAGVILLHNSVNDKETSTGFSEDKSCPNNINGLYKSDDPVYGNCRQTPWNTIGNQMRFVDWNIPIFLMQNETEISYVENNCYNQTNQAKNGRPRSWPLCAIEMVMFNLAAGSTETCMRRNNLFNSLDGNNKVCDPLEDENIYAFVPETNKSEPLNPSSVLVLAARMDSFSMFSQSDPGAVSALSNVIAMLAVAEAVGRNIERLQPDDGKHLMFVLFNGEAFDYIGSSRMVWDMSKDEFPDKLDDKIANQSALFNLSHIDLFLELNQLVPNVQNPNYYLHVDPKFLSDKVKQACNSLVTNSKGLIKDADYTAALPPASLQTFLKQDSTVPGVVITDHKTNYTNKFYNSFLDTPLKFDFDKSVDNIAKLSDIVVQFIINRTFSKTPLKDFSVNKTFIETVAKCFWQWPAWNCSVIEKIIDSIQSTQNRDLFRKAINSYPYQRTYSSIKLSRVRYFASYMMRYVLGKKLDWTNKTGDSCKVTSFAESSDDIHSYVYMKDIFNNESNETFCVVSTVKTSTAKSPAFEITDYDYSDKKFSTWTESIWNTPRLRMFMKPSPAWEGGVFGVGLAVFLISMVSVYVLNKGSETLFASNVVAL